MYKIVYNEKRHSFTIFKLNTNSGKEEEMFYTKDSEALYNFAITKLSIAKEEMNKAIDSLQLEKHAVMEFGFNRTFVISYNLDH